MRLFASFERTENMKGAARTKYLMAAILAIGLFSASSGTSENACDPEDLTFEGWSNWFEITSEPVKSVGHSNNWVGIYVDELAKDVYLNAGSRYPVCARVVKPIYYDSDGERVRKLTIMVKMPPGYDPENGDWWYASSDAAGVKLAARGRRRDCITCHKQAAETDYLFSADVMDAAKN